MLYIHLSIFQFDTYNCYTKSTNNSKYPMQTKNSRNQIHSHLINRDDSDYDKIIIIRICTYKIKQLKVIYLCKITLHIHTPSYKFCMYEHHFSVIYLIFVHKIYRKYFFAKLEKGKAFCGAPIAPLFAPPIHLPRTTQLRFTQYHSVCVWWLTLYRAKRFPYDTAHTSTDIHTILASLVFT